ncbi:unnamed protein product (macronuclear) [Paramecium tetraurelia]|uniref:Protein kinase domain-containing protein n=1 Tax=Paramecium tetraurelia TaxID=5888 RepID=A0BML8_PARTE|nr:uncharacterized protein GSPATT00030421001 [Paramecium tetraurelia]CAK59785.1 unnamed protein product [Paramecium tetraurelia]|eukprot:XP_001427183.1 hypothetical protein (macronuclear) [Paramecium tetraurelia strain d4-2]
MSSNSQKLQKQNSQSDNEIDAHQNKAIKQDCVQIQAKSKNIQKKNPEQIRAKQVQIDQISQFKFDSSLYYKMNLREQTIYDFDFLKIDKDLLSNQTQILIEDKKSKKKFLIKPIQTESEIIQKLFQLNSKFILTPQNIFSHHVQTQKIDNLAKEIKIIHLKFQLLLFQYCSKSILHFSHELSNAKLKIILGDLLQALMSAKENQLVLDEITLDSILYCEENNNFKLNDYANATIGDNQSNVTDLGMCFAQLIQQKNSRRRYQNLQINLNEWKLNNKDDPFTSITLQMIMNEKSLDEINYQLQLIDC